MDSSIATQNVRGEWVPAVPLPIYLPLWRCGCPECGRKFWRLGSYHGHYAYVHILGLGKQDLAERSA